MEPHPFIFGVDHWLFKLYQLAVSVSQSEPAMLSLAI